MRLVRYAVLAPLAFLVACGGVPQSIGHSGGTGRGDVPGADPLRGGGQLAGLPNGSGADPNRLKGLSPLQLRSVLGTPVFTRRDAPAEIWQYRGHACTLDLFLYDDESIGQRVAHYAVRSQQPVPVNESQCLGELVGKSQGIPTS